MSDHARKEERARPGFEPGTSRTLSENHTPRPTSQTMQTIRDGHVSMTSSKRAQPRSYTGSLEHWTELWKRRPQHFLGHGSK